MLSLSAMYCMWIRFNCCEGTCYHLVLCTACGSGSVATGKHTHSNMLLLSAMYCMWIGFTCCEGTCYHLVLCPACGSGSIAVREHVIT